MKRVVAEKLDPRTREVLVARTLPARSVACRVAESEGASGVGVVQLTAANGELKTLRIGTDQNDYQQVRIYSGERLIETLAYRDGSVIHTNQ